jgi:hypothetical protein
MSCVEEDIPVSLINLGDNTVRIFTVNLNEFLILYCNSEEPGKNIVFSRHSYFCMNMNLFSIGGKPCTTYLTHIAQFIQRLFRKLSAVKK